MALSHSDTTSPIPFSPFSSNSVGSELTSDDPADLGAFHSVFHALNYLHQPSIPNTTVNITPSSSLFVSPSDYDSDAPVSDIWPQKSLSLTSDDDDTAFESPEKTSTRRSSPATLGEDTANFTVDEDEVPQADPFYQPSLGYLDEALNFIAEERARLTAQLEAKVQRLAVLDSQKQNDTRRKRRRKKAKSLTRILQREGRHKEETHSDDTERVRPDPDEEGEDSSDSPELSFSSFPSTPPKASGSRRNGRRQSTLRVTRSRSTPTLRLAVSVPLDPHVLQLRALAHKLRLLFPEDASTLSSILSDDYPDVTHFVDPRGPSPQSSDPVIHVFIDHSNILIGFLNYLRRNLHHSTRKSKHMSHSSLALILERGRPISRRVLVTSSPLYQPMDSAEQLGYEVRIYARVPDTGDGADRRHSGDFSRGKGGKKTAPIPIQGHARKSSNSGGTSTESENAGALGSSPHKGSTSRGHGRHPSGHITTVAPIVTPGGRVRYREQGVDELLQLKLLQAIADIDVPPPNATIVLATGDGNVGQFNEEGFLGCVRIALKKGWRVELYAWEGGLSRAWKREFGSGPFSENFRIIGMEKFGADLIEI
ncbi:hypothetical protein NEOLEDRAFT_1178030 [Neolentinus lepideus HHB14362 ss-1]|uniref:NYN domain-containing protein n=1 Tax=Neolentinus lepideus HHB14362 ss-1 TaxID=1314782 RepID=A0A165SZ99_9AGAM|nr:hypothetical protein NEOLEDRAFT_1178030 [Neolentinus lepideus HHB14362 ss-1]